MLHHARLFFFFQCESCRIWIRSLHINPAKCSSDWVTYLESLWRNIQKCLIHVFLFLCSLGILSNHSSVNQAPFPTQSSCGTCITLNATSHHRAPGTKYLLLRLWVLWKNNYASLQITRGFLTPCLQPVVAKVPYSELMWNTPRSSSAFLGMSPFWLLPREDLLETQVIGVDARAPTSTAASG